MDFEIQAPEKSNYKFNEVASITGVKPYVLRFWESEFQEINPSLNELGEKVYSSGDIELIQKIKSLLFESKLSIPEVKFELSKEEEEESIQSSIPESHLVKNSEDLKLALEKIIDVHSSSPKEKSKFTQISDSSRIETVKSDFINESKLMDKDIVNLVSAKKKLTILLDKIHGICEVHNW